MHHVARDARSSHVLVDDLGALYDAALRGEPVALPRALSPQQVTARLRELAAADAAEDPGRVVRILDALAGTTPGARLLPDVPPGAAPRPASRETLPLGSTGSAPLRDLAESLGVSPFAVLAAAVAR